MNVPIEAVTIELTMADGSTEEFLLEAPNGADPYRFGFAKVPLQPDYRDAAFTMQTGRFVYQFLADYIYLSHSMDIRKLLVARHIELRFPPDFTDVELYQTATVYLSNPGALKNYLAGFAGATAGGDAVPSADLTLNFLGTEPLNPAAVQENIWDQPEPGDPIPDLPGEGALIRIRRSRTTASGYTTSTITGSPGTGAPITSPVTDNETSIVFVDAFARFANQSGGAGNFQWSLYRSFNVLVSEETGPTITNAPCSDPMPVEFAPQVTGQLFTSLEGQNNRFRVTLRRENFGSGFFCFALYRFEAYVRLVGIDRENVVLDDGDEDIEILEFVDE